ncbi:MAG TPA: hypothetical protein VHR86_10500 [Armatimonadota bacterium]|nr:hypothetical protein [Armatimonadota bacterium]
MHRGVYGGEKQKSLSLFDLFSLGFGAIIGVGWSVTLNNMFINGGGPLPATLGFGLGVIDLLTIIGSTGFAIGWGLACLSAVRLRGTEPDMPRPYKLPGGVKTAWVGAIFCGIFLINCIVPGLPGYMGTPGMIMLGLWSGLGAFSIFQRAGSAAAESMPKTEYT